MFEFDIIYHNVVLIYNYELDVQIAIVAHCTLLLSYANTYRLYFDEDTDYECEYAHQLHESYYRNGIYYSYIVMLSR